MSESKPDDVIDMEAARTRRLLRGQVPRMLQASAQARVMYDEMAARGGEVVCPSCGGTFLRAPDGGPIAHMRRDSSWCPSRGNPFESR